METANDSEMLVGEAEAGLGRLTISVENWRDLLGPVDSDEPSESSIEIIPETEENSLDGLEIEEEVQGSEAEEAEKETGGSWAASAEDLGTGEPTDSSSPIAGGKFTIALAQANILVEGVMEEVEPSEVVIEELPRSLAMSTAPKGGTPSGRTTRVITLQNLRDLEDKVHAKILEDDRIRLEKRGQRKNWDLPAKREPHIRWDDLGAELDRLYGGVRDNIHKIRRAERAYAEGVTYRSGERWLQHETKHLGEARETLEELKNLMIEARLKIGATWDDVKEEKRVLSSKYGRSLRGGCNAI